MGVSVQASINTPTLFLNQEMLEPEMYRVAVGNAAVFSKRSPAKDSANEDAAAILPWGKEECILAVADGVGGQRLGDEAARRAIDALTDAVAGAQREKGDIRSAILNGFEEANRAVLELGNGAATTLAVAAIYGNAMRSYHVGDSMILLCGQRGKLKLQSIAHSPVGYGLESGLLDEHDAMHHEERHIVSNVIGTQDMRIEIGPKVELGQRDTLVIASDGLSDNLLVEEIVDIVRKGPLGESALELSQKCAQRMAHEDNGTPSKPDDLTLLLFRLQAS